MSTKSEHYKQLFTKNDMPGYLAIQAAERELYGDQEPAHWANMESAALGGGDLLWGTDCFLSLHQQEHFHHISLGLSNLFYDEEAAENEVSGFGFELTFRHFPVEGDPARPAWPSLLLRNLAAYVHRSGSNFGDYHYMSANGPLRVGTDTAITAMAFLSDPELSALETPNGKVDLIQIFGITTNEYNDLRKRKYTVRELLENHLASNPLLITDLTRS